MKQIDEILDNLAASIESKIIIERYDEETLKLRVEPRLLNSRYGTIFSIYRLNEGILKLEFLEQCIYVQKVKTESGKEYIFNQEKLIFEPIKDKLSPCIHCLSELNQIKQLGSSFFNFCSVCHSRGASYHSREIAILKHDEIYRKVHGKNCNG